MKAAATGVVVEDKRAQQSLIKAGQHTEHDLTDSNMEHLIRMFIV